MTPSNRRPRNSRQFDEQHQGSNRQRPIYREQAVSLNREPRSQQ
jgi:hypothetical protein